MLSEIICFVVPEAAISLTRPVASMISRLGMSKSEPRIALQATKLESYSPKIIFLLLTFIRVQRFRARAQRAFEHF